MTDQEKNNKQRLQNPILDVFKDFTFLSQVFRICYHCYYTNTDKKVDEQSLN